MCSSHVIPRAIFPSHLRHTPTPRPGSPRPGSAAPGSSDGTLGGQTFGDFADDVPSAVTRGRTLEPFCAPHCARPTTPPWSSNPPLYPLTCIMTLCTANACVNSFGSVDFLPNFFGEIPNSPRCMARCSVLGASFLSAGDDNISLLICSHIESTPVPRLPFLELTIFAASVAALNAIRLVHLLHETRQMSLREVLPRPPRHGVTRDFVFHP